MNSTSAMRLYLDHWGEIIEVALNAISIVFIVLGILISMVKVAKIRLQGHAGFALRVHFKRMIGGWLLVALEFQLAADIVGTSISQTYEHLIQLGVVALIRTLLNYFLSKELSEPIMEQEFKQRPNEI